MALPLSSAGERLGLYRRPHDRQGLGRLPIVIPLDRATPRAKCHCQFPAVR